ncbi:hypothetical protein ACH5RR_028931 [Cinchona calisaya]|uniref:CCHC-type domain-containing protein n=1 Tax=Cinchona calisaya TaxID=153742 RepID=A0ABD2YU38_9GENT
MWKRTSSKVGISQTNFAIAGRDLSIVLGIKEVGHEEQGIEEPEQHEPHEPRQKHKHVKATTACDVNIFHGEQIQVNEESDSLNSDELDSFYSSSDEEVRPTSRPKKARRKEPDKQISDPKGIKEHDLLGITHMTCLGCHQKGHTVQKCPQKLTKEELVVSRMARGPSINSNKCSKCHLSGHNIRSCPGEQVEKSSMHAEMQQMQARESNMQAEMQHMQARESNVQAKMAYMQAKESNMQAKMTSILPKVQGIH